MPGTTSSAFPSFSHDQHHKTDAAKRKGGGGRFHSVHCSVYCFMLHLLKYSKQLVIAVRPRTDCAARPAHPSAVHSPTPATVGSLLRCLVPRRQAADTPPGACRRRCRQEIRSRCRCGRRESLA